jgi:glycosyltransferase involved in cell wall biosynthesis
LDLSILIPTHRRPGKLGACLSRLASQTLAHDRYEVLVALDGPDEVSAHAAYTAWGDSPARLVVVPCPRRGYNAARNEILRLAQGRYLLSLNDDILPEPAFLQSHLRAHAETESAGPAIITGYSPFIAFENETLFDTLARETSMIFFYDQMVAGPPSPHDGPSSLRPYVPLSLRPFSHDWGFRHCWGLNFSAPLEAVRDAGGFVSFPLCYGYDDIELAFRLKERFNTPVLFRPAARADHDHRYSPRDVLEREFKLGQAAWQFAGINPAFAGAVFKRDIRAEEELAYSREFVQRESAAAERLERSFLALAQTPAESIAGPHRAALLTLIYEQHLLLKRYHWRRGLLAAASLYGSASPAASDSLSQPAAPATGFRVVQV